MTVNFTTATSQRGLTYIEVLVATVIVSFCLAPAIDALSTGLRGAAVSQDLTVQHYRLLEKMEDVLAESYGSLKSAAEAAGSETVPSSYSDAVATPNRRLVFLSEYDADNADADNDPFTGKDANLLWVRVKIENMALSMESLTVP